MDLSRRLVPLVLLAVLGASGCAATCFGRLERDGGDNPPGAAPAAAQARDDRASPSGCRETRNADI